MEQQMFRPFKKGGVIRTLPREPNTPDKAYKRPTHNKNCVFILTEGPEVGSVCGKLTNEGKDKCKRHVAAMPYVAALLQEIESDAEKQNRVMEVGVRAANLTDNAAKDIIQFLSFKSRTLPGLARDTSFPQKVVMVYCRLLKKAGVITIEENKRKVPIYRIV